MNTDKANVDSSSSTPESLSEAAQTYYGDWLSFEDMVKDFEGYGVDLQDAMTKDRWQGLTVLFAAYTYECYEGDALVIFKKDDQLYEVNGGHCSCYGLSERNYHNDGPDQWEPEETTKEAILHRLVSASYGISSQFKDEILSALARA
jgi:hypothetical protein